MKSNHRQILRAIYSAIDEVNPQLPKNQQLKKVPQTVLFGKRGKVDSLGLVNLIVAIEQNINRAFGVALTLADDRAFAQKQNPFETISSLIKYVAILLTEQENEKK